MTSRPHCILITGMGHSGTRLLVEMLARHPDVSVPLHILNAVQEYNPLHRFFVQAIDRTPLYSDEYWLDEQELAFVLEAYMQHIDMKKSHFVLKQPSYPLYYLDFFTRYFDNKLSLVYTERPVEKIVKSWLRNNSFFFEPEEMLRQPKKLQASERQRYLTDIANRESVDYLHAVYKRCEALRDEWDRQHPEQPFIRVDMELLAHSKPYLGQILEQLNLSNEATENMLALIDHNRLFHGRRDKAESKLKTLLRSLTPPLVWQWLSSTKQRLQQNTF